MTQPIDAAIEAAKEVITREFADIAIREVTDLYNFTMAVLLGKGEPETAPEQQISECITNALKSAGGDLDERTRIVWQLQQAALKAHDTRFA